MQFLQIYDDNEALIIERRNEFESNLDIDKTMRIYAELCRTDDDFIDQDENDRNNFLIQNNPDIDRFEQLLNNPNARINDDMYLASINKLGPIAKKRDNLMEHEDFYNLMRMANKEQRELLEHLIYTLLCPQENAEPVQFYLSGPAGFGKTFTITLVKEIFNRFTDNDGILNAFIVCASTGKAAIAIDGTTVHTAFKITLRKLQEPLKPEVLHQYRSLFRYFKIIIIDEVSMISAELLTKLDARLKQITGDQTRPFGGLHILLSGDLRQIPAVNATAIYKQPKSTIAGPQIWRSLNFFEFTQVVRQEDRAFSTLLTKIGDGLVITREERAMLNTRMFT